MGNRRPLAAVAALAAAAMLAPAQEYDLYIVEALSTFGIPESYLSELNNEGVAAGFMTCTEQDPGGSYAAPELAGASPCARVNSTSRPAESTREHREQKDAS